uniref:Peptidase C1A papain C-terminal domain-containing protein n=1 Tax=Globodera rostochiensis TaxID=31243 RepID=A0A914GVG5_GLORO
MIAVGIVLLNFINLFILYAGNVPRMQLEKSFANSAALVAHVNARQTSWTAELHPQFANMPPEALNRLMGVRGPFPEKRQRVPSGNEYNGNFDARKHFPKCAEVISTIQDQGLCGSCWAVSAASFRFYLTFKDCYPCWPLIGCAFALGCIAIVGLVTNASVIYITVKIKALRGTANYLLALTSAFEILHQLGPFSVCLHRILWHQFH